MFNAIIYWIKGIIFEAGISDAETYTIVIPPPNVKGMLHIGHALDFTLQDILIRAKRMQGFDTLCLPRHGPCGLATQTRWKQKLREERLIPLRSRKGEIPWRRYGNGKEVMLGTYLLFNGLKWAFLLIICCERFTLDEGLVASRSRSVCPSIRERTYLSRQEDPSQAGRLVTDIEVEHKEVNGHFVLFCNCFKYWTAAL